MQRLERLQRIELGLLVLLTGVIFCFVDNTEGLIRGLPALPGSRHGADSESCVRSDPLMNPVYEIRMGRDVVWQIPTNPKAVLFIAHGGEREPESYFDWGPNCTLCYGFPEDRLAVLAALGRGYALIMVKSLDSDWYPWQIETWPPPISSDMAAVETILKDWTAEYSLDHLPLAAFGHSIGGFFMSLMFVLLDIKSLVIMVGNVQVGVLEHAVKGVFPPTLFIPMPMDADYYSKIAGAIAALKSNGVLVEEVDSWPRAVSPRLFSDRIPCLGLNSSQKIFAAYKAEGWLDENDFIVINPRLNDWESVLKKWDVLPSCKTKSSKDPCLAQHVRQELLVCYGEHAFTSWHNEELFDWFDRTVFDQGITSGMIAFS